MKTIQRIIYAGFATAALASASVPALAYTVWPDVDFEWYANVGKPLVGATAEVYPAPREGYIWAPGHWENEGSRQVWVEGQWIADDYEQQRTLAIRDREGNVIPTSPDAYPIDSTRR
jgi:YXWGXW repeat-containing protein